MPVTPDDIAAMLPGRPVLTSRDLGWRSVVLHRYRHSPSFVDLPPLRDNALVLNLAGPTLIEEVRDGGRHERRWHENGHMNLTPAGQAVQRELKGRTDVAVIHIEPTLVSEVAHAVYGAPETNLCLHPRFAVYDGCVEIVGKLLMSEAETGDPGNVLAADMLARSLTVRLLRCHSSLGNRVPEPPPRLPNRRVKRVIDYMQAHIGETLPLARLAELSGLSPSHFARAFRDATGEPPHRYLVRLRLKKACELLEHTDLLVIDVAFRCGFEQPGHFVTTFRRFTGITPRAWRLARRL